MHKVCPHNNIFGNFLLDSWVSNVSEHIGHSGSKDLHATGISVTVDEDEGGDDEDADTREDENDDDEDEDEGDDEENADTR